MKQPTNKHNVDSEGHIDRYLSNQPDSQLPSLIRNGIKVPHKGPLWVKKDPLREHDCFIRDLLLYMLIWGYMQLS